MRHAIGKLMFLKNGTKNNSKIQQILQLYT